MTSTSDIIDDLTFFDDWEERYKYIIDLGKELAPMEDALKTPERIVKGCQSSVWLHYEQLGDRFHFTVDSDAIIVRGLLAVVLAAFQDKTSDEISQFDIDGYFKAIDLENHLSPTRGNGLRSIVGTIKALGC